MLRDALLLIIVLGLVPFILRRAWIGALAWTWIGLMNPHLYSWSLRDFPFAQLIGVTFLVSWAIARDKRMIPLTPETIGLLLLIGFIVIKTPFAWDLDVAWTNLTQFLKIVVATLIIATLIYTPQRVRWLMWTVMFSLGAHGIKGGVFALLSGGEERVQGPEPSFIGGNTHLGVALLMILPLFVAFLRDASTPWLKRGGIAGFWLTLLACVFTYSRGTWLGLAAVAPLLFLQTRRKVLVGLALVPIALGLIAFTPEKLFQRVDTIAEYEQDLSSLQRLQGWGVAVNVALRHPLGAGFVLDATPVEVWMQYANFHHPAFNRANAAHSIYFQWIGDHGFLGLALFIFIVVATLITLRRVRNLAIGDPEKKWLADYAVAIQLGLVGYLVSGAFVSLAYFDLFYTYVVLAGILLREARSGVGNAQGVPSSARRTNADPREAPAGGRAPQRPAMGRDGTRA